MSSEEETEQMVDSLVDLIDGWNDAGYEPDEKGRSNHALCLLLWDDGSGRIGTSYLGHSDEVLFNEQFQFSSPRQLVLWLKEQL